MGECSNIYSESCFFLRFTSIPHLLNLGSPSKHPTSDSVTARGICSTFRVVPKAAGERTLPPEVNNGDQLQARFSEKLLGSHHFVPYFSSLLHPPEGPATSWESEPEILNPAALGNRGKATSLLIALTCTSPTPKQPSQPQHSLVATTQRPQLPTQARNKAHMLGLGRVVLVPPQS